MKRCILFQGISFPLACLACQIHKLVSDFIVIHDGIEPDEGLLQLLEKNGIEHFDYTKKTIKDLLECLTQRGYDRFIFHAETYKACRLIEPMKKLYDIHVMLVMNAYRYGRSYRNLVMKYIKYRYSPIVDTWIFLSQQSRIEFCRVANVYDQSFVVPWGVEDCLTINKALTYTDIFTNKENLYQSDIKYIFYLARFDKYKAHQQLINLTKEYLHDGLVKLVLAGNGEKINYIHQLCTEYGIANNVIFLGRVPRQLLLSHVKNAFLALVLSKCETFGYNILEPLQLGIPVISTPTGIAPQIITDFRNGFTIAQKNKNKWKNILSGVMNGSIQLEAKHQELYTWPEVAKIYTKLYSHIIRIV